MVSSVWSCCPRLFTVVQVSCFLHALSLTMNLFSIVCWAPCSLCHVFSLPWHEMAFCSNLCPKWVSASRQWLPPWQQVPLRVSSGTRTRLSLGCIMDLCLFISVFFCFHVISWWRWLHDFGDGVSQIIWDDHYTRAVQNQPWLKHIHHIGSYSTGIKRFSTREQNIWKVISVLNCSSSNKIISNIQWWLKNSMPVFVLYYQHISNIKDFKYLSLQQDQRHFTVSWNFYWNYLFLHRFLFNKAILNCFCITFLNHRFTNLLDQLKVMLFLVDYILVNTQMSTSQPSVAPVPSPG